MALYAMGSVRGLGILWVSIYISFGNWTTSLNTLLSQFECIGSTKKVWLIGVYGPTLRGEKIGFLRNLQHLKDLLGDTSWLLVGDFNFIKDLEEKKGGVIRFHLISLCLQGTIQDLGVEDTNFVNGSFTWNN